MRNKITDLNNHLFALLERLSDEEITADQLTLEINRSKSINDISLTIIESAKITVEVMKLMEKSGMKLDPIVTNLLEGEKISA